MGNSSFGAISNYSCNDGNLSRNSITPEYWETSSISDEYRANSIATAVIMLVLLLVGVPCNITIIFSIFHQRLYKEATHILLLNLAISDLLVCLLVMPFIIVTGFAGEYIFGNSDYTRCQVCKTGLIFTGLTVLSLNIVGLISIDRFIFIKFPLRYNRYVTANRVLVVLIAVWLLSTFEAILPLFGFGDIRFAYPNTACLVSFVGESKLIALNVYYAVVLVVLSLLPLIAIIITNVSIACIARRQIRSVYKIRQTFRNKADLDEYDAKLGKEINRQKNRKQLVLIRAFGAILVSNFVVYTPLVIVTVLFLVLDESVGIPLGVLTFVHISLMIHSIIHPLIEGLFIPEIKATFRKLFCIILCQQLRTRTTSNTPSGSNAVTSSVDMTMSEDDGLISYTGNCLDNCNLALLPISQT